MEETEAAFVQQNQHDRNGEQHELASNICKDNHIRNHEERHRASRLLKMLLSDKFAEDFAFLGDVIRKDELTDEQKNNKPFWTWVEEGHINHDDTGCGKLQFTDNTHFKGGAGIDPLGNERHG